MGCVVPSLCVPGTGDMLDRGSAAPPEQHVGMVVRVACGIWLVPQVMTEASQGNKRKAFSGSVLGHNWESHEEE